LTHLSVIGLLVLVLAIAGCGGGRQSQDVVVTAKSVSGGSASQRSVATGAVVASDVTWPASYTNGPLGANNVLPNTQNGVLLGDWGGVQGKTQAQQEQFIRQREADMNRHFDLIGTMLFNGTVNGISNCANLSGIDVPAFAHSRRAVPIVHWTPDLDLRQINSGSVDRCYKGVADYLKTFRYRVMLRLMWEFNDPYVSVPIYPCGNNYTSHGGPSAFVAAWRHIVRIFRTEGATNVGFWWVPAEGQDRHCADLSYPGDTYVDWVGSDSYNWAGTKYNSPCVQGWAEFNRMFNYRPTPSCKATSTYSRYGARKPFVVGETATKYDSSNPTRKPNWFRNIVSVAAPAMPNLHGIVFFDQYIASGDDWRVDSDQTSSSTTPGPIDPNGRTYQGFLDLSHAAVFNSGVAGGPS
jgi:hypothetical protein